MKKIIRKLSLILIVVAVIGILLLGINREKKENLFITNFVGENREVYILNDKENYQNPVCKIGVDIEEKDEIITDTLSVELTKELHIDKILEQEIETLQLIYNIGVIPFENMDWDALLGLLGEWEGTSYISIVANKEHQDEQFEAFNTLKELISTKEYEGIELVYFVNNEETLGRIEGNGVEYIGFNIHTKLDILLLENVYDRLQSNKMNIIINDYLGNQGIDLKQVLDEIQAFYYLLPIKYKNIDLVFNQTKWDKVHDKVQNLYRQIYQNPWLTTSKDIKNEESYIHVQPINSRIRGTIELITWANAEEISYVEYKLNDQQVEKVTRFPYIFEINTNELLDGFNKVSISIYSKEGVQLDTKETYLDINNDRELKERADRRSDGYPVENQPTYKKQYIPVLMYHEFKTVVPEEETSITVGTALFEEQLQALLKEGYTPINFLDLKNYLKGIGGLPQKPIIITTDDGYLSNYTEAFPILKKYNVQATFFITTHYVGVDIGFDHFTWDEAREMEASGLIDIQSHTHAHRLLNQTYKEDALYQVDRSFSIIEDELGKRDLKVLAYPQFRHNKETISWLTSIGIDLQITNLAKLVGSTTPINVQRIHVSNDMTPEELIKKIEKLTH